VKFDLFDHQYCSVFSGYVPSLNTCGYRGCLAIPANVLIQQTLQRIATMNWNAFWYWINPLNWARELINFFSPSHSSSLDAVTMEYCDEEIDPTDHDDDSEEDATE
jgi:hypothetical protein